jgi:hypothetical protein
MGELDIPDRPTGRHAAVTVRGDVPAMPVVPSHTLYRGSPYLLVNNGQRYSLGWSDTRKDGPCFVVARISVMDTIKVLDRFPFTEDGWAYAWAALVQLDEGAASAVRDRLAASEARGRADGGLAELDAATVSYLPQAAFLGGYAYEAELAVSKPYDLRFLDDRLAVFSCRLIDVLVESPYSDVEAVEIGGPGLIKSGGGFIGGGVGLAGAAEGMAIAATDACPQRWRAPQESGSCALISAARPPVVLAAPLVPAHLVQHPRPPIGLFKITWEQG